MTAVERRPNLPEGAISESFQPGPERSISINMGGGSVVVINSDTVAPEMLRWIKKVLENGSWGCEVHFFPD